MYCVHIWKEVEFVEHKVVITCQHTYLRFLHLDLVLNIETHPTLLDPPHSLTGHTLRIPPYISLNDNVFDSVDDRLDAKLDGGKYEWVSNNDGVSNGGDD